METIGTGKMYRLSGHIWGAVGKVDPHFKARASHLHSGCVSKSRKCNAFLYKGETDTQFANRLTTLAEHFHSFQSPAKLRKMSSMAMYEMFAGISDGSWRRQ